jgi:hypothetical protein
MNIQNTIWGHPKQNQLSLLMRLLEDGSFFLDKNDEVRKDIMQKLILPH